MNCESNYGYYKTLISVATHEIGSIVTSDNSRVLLQSSHEGINCRLRRDHNADRHLDITFGMQLVESCSLVSVLFRKAFNDPYISFFHLLVNGFSVTCFHTFFADPLPSFNWWAVTVGGEELKWHQLAHHQLRANEGLILVHTVKLKPIIKAQISGNLVTSGISDVAIAKVHSEKTRMKKMIVIIM